MIAVQVFEQMMVGVLRDDRAVSGVDFALAAERE
jgi:hypothetical protein